MEYPIIWKDTAIGTAEVTRQGLYYDIHCCCMLPDREIYRLIISCGEKEENLGIVVPFQDGFGLHTRVQIRKLGEGELQFHLAEKKKTEARCFIPINPEDPFPDVISLKKAVLEIRNGVLGASVPKE